MVSVARGVLEKGMIIPGLSNTPLVLPTFESNVLFILRFMVDCKVRHNKLCSLAVDSHQRPPTQVTGGNWVQLPPGAWQHTKRRVSTCQVCLQHVVWVQTPSYDVARSSRSTSCTTSS